MSARMNMTRNWVPAVMAAVLLVATAAAHASTGTVTYVYTDPQGTPLAEANASGAITATFDYAPYGSQALGAPPNGPGYTGHVNDPDTGLVYMQARYYDPTVGRFISTDPVGPAAGNPFNFNRYDYANNNPVVNMDPDGRCTGSHIGGDGECAGGGFTLGPGSVMFANPGAGGGGLRNAGAPSKSARPPPRSGEGTGGVKLPPTTTHIAIVNSWLDVSGFQPQGTVDVVLELQDGGHHPITKEGYQIQEHLDKPVRYSNQSGWKDLNKGRIVDTHAPLDESKRPLNGRVSINQWFSIKAPDGKITNPDTVMRTTAVYENGSATVNTDTIVR